ncbi:Clp protease proteolytic subunit /Translocation-enhancing protein TepA [uncultured Caudovirales phage]|uniref:Clp protease proteolytic subunit /Translocation-enhancing protein TepA n=1 Tax=uncultured Caudovirales phage TaxID=2100421 RepID=A0A6J7X5L3_9CAUD|nr:Clp protease proteolytic subunit /Translocation-enhancing protein TepA [uncultured Caudovirales phage]
MKIVIDRPIGEKDSFADYYGEPQMCFSGAEMAALLQGSSDSEIEVELRSPGGSVEQGLMIYDLLRNSGKKVKTVGYQLHSIASIIFLAGDERLISENATPLLHHPALLPWDLDGRLTANDLESIAEAIATLEGRMMSIYTERMGLNPENAALFDEKLQSEWTMTADDAVMWGLATGKIQTTANAAKIKGLFYSEKAIALKKPNTQYMDLSKALEELKGIIKDAKASFTGKAKAGSVTTTSETVKVLYFEGDQLESGKAVFIDEAMTTAAPAGSYEIDGGMTVLIETDESGVSTVTSITEESEDVEALKKENENMKAELEAMKKEKADAEAKAEAAATALKAMGETLTSLESKVQAFEKIVPGDTDPNKVAKAATALNHEAKMARIFGKKY